MKYLSLLCMALLMFSCTTPVKNDTAEVVATSPEEIAEEIISDIAPESLDLSRIVGKWDGGDEKLGIKMELEFAKDGVYRQNIAGQEVSGTWEKISDDKVKVTHQYLQGGQTWTVRHVDDQAATIVWTTKSGKEKPMSLVRM